MSSPASRDVILQVAEPLAAATFYERLGMTRFMDEPGLVGMEAGAFRLFIESGALSGPVFEFLVDDLAHEKERLVGQGCAIVDDDPAVPRCYVRDPFGLMFNIAERASQA